LRRERLLGRRNAGICPAFSLWRVQEEAMTEAEALALRILTENNLTVLQKFEIQM
jgi:hypothetical protein